MSSAVCPLSPSRGALHAFCRALPCCGGWLSAFPSRHRSPVRCCANPCWGGAFPGALREVSSRSLLIPRRGEQPPVPAGRREEAACQGRRDAGAAAWDPGCEDRGMAPCWLGVMEEPHRRHQGEDTSVASSSSPRHRQAKRLHFSCSSCCCCAVLRMARAGCGASPWRCCRWRMLETRQCPGFALLLQVHFQGLRLL